MCQKSRNSVLIAFTSQRSRKQGCELGERREEEAWGLERQENVWKAGAEKAVRGPRSMGATLESWILNRSEGSPWLHVFLHSPSAGHVQV